MENTDPESTDIGRLTVTATKVNKSSPSSFNLDKVFGKVGEVGTGIDLTAGALSLVGDSRVSSLLDNNFRRGVFGHYQLTGRSLSLFGSKVNSYTMPTSKFLSYGSRLGKWANRIGMVSLGYDAV